MSDSTRKRGLGRGLGALIVSTDPSLPSPTDEADSRDEHTTPGEGGVRLVPVSAIAPNPRQPRTRFSEETLLELAASIREHGIIQPLIVSKHSEDEYELIAGERRWRAAQRAGVEVVPVLVRETTPQQLLELALIENV